MNISQEQIAAIADKILTEYQAAVDAELMSCLNKENFDYLYALHTLSEIYQRHCGRLYGLIDLLDLESARYFSPLKETVRAVIEQLLEQSILNGRVLLDISEARRHGKDAETTGPLPLTLAKPAGTKTAQPELTAEAGVTVACPPGPGDKPDQQTAKKSTQKKKPRIHPYGVSVKPLVSAPVETAEAVRVSQ